jgi:hypothetical protein
MLFTLHCPATCFQPEVNFVSQRIRNKVLWIGQIALLLSDQTIRRDRLRRKNQP